MSTLSKLQQFIDRHRLLPHGQGLVIGVSGGPDSLALVHALWLLAPANHWHLHIAHLHHGLRSDAHADARFVAEMATAWDLGITIERCDVGKLAKTWHLSVEEAARQARYDFLGRVAVRMGIKRVAVGHHADDQAETILMHLLRGSGLAGLRGMLPETDLGALRLSDVPLQRRKDLTGIALVRPWLETSRVEIASYCQHHGLSPRFDETNQDLSFYRNRLRHQVMPLLHEFNPQFTEVMARTASALQGDYEVLDQHRQDLWRHMVKDQGRRVRFDMNAFRALPVGDQRALLRRAIASLRPRLRNVNWAHTENILKVLAADPERASGGPYPLVESLEAFLNYQFLDIIDREFAARERPQLEAAVSLPLPGSARIDTDWWVTARRIRWQRPAPPVLSAPAQTIWIPLEVAQPLTLRPRRPGDRMRPFGMDGSKAISHLMTDLKMPRQVRRRWPLLEDGQGEILWLVGYRASEACRIPADAGEAWMISIKRQPQPTTLALTSDAT